MKYSNFFLAALLSLMFVFAGCSSNNTDCSELNDAYTTYVYDSESKECKVASSVQKNVCGNGVAEQGETFCNCESDVQRTNPQNGCFGEVGEYLEKTCHNEECQLKQNNKVVSQTKSLELSNSDLTFNSEFTIDNPYIVNTVDKSEIIVDMNYFRDSTSYNIRNVNVIEMEIQDRGSIILASTNYGQEVEVGQNLPRKTFQLSQTSDYETKQQLIVKLTVSYDKDYLNSQGDVTRTENRIETLTGNLGSWTIINPNFYDE